MNYKRCHETNVVYFLRALSSFVFAFSSLSSTYFFQSHNFVIKSCSEVKEMIYLHMETWIKYIQYMVSFRFMEIAFTVSLHNLKKTHTTSFIFKKTTVSFPMNSPHHSLSRNKPQTTSILISQQSFIYTYFYHLLNWIELLLEFHWKINKSNTNNWKGKLFLIHSIEAWCESIWLNNGQYFMNFRKYELWD